MMRWSMLLVVLVACTPEPVPPPITLADGGPVNYVAMCSRLAELGCSEGAAPNCAPVLEHAVTAAITTLDVSCLAAAANKSDVRSCGSVRCE